MRLFFVAVIAALFSGQVQAGSVFYTGDILMKEFRECYVEQTENRDQLFYDCGLARGYITGVYDSMQHECVPEDLMSDQLWPAVKKWLDENPGDWHFTADYLIKTAVRETWPCPE